ncbi:MAG TPA: hypothetical protein DIT64_07130 [Verrucomicrobiales bacterium]|nr:hypothetical protein [Verrucomicrobiales bacterium]
MNRFLFHFLLLLLAGAAHAQFEIKGGATNLLDQRRAGASATVSGGAVNAITVRGGGGGYTVAPAVTIAAPPSGTTATATANISGGVVTSITVNTGGTGYTTPPAIFIAPPVTPGGGATTTPQFAGRATTSATAGAISTAGVTAGRYPRAQDVTVPASPVVTIVLARASFGHSFASGVPRYFMGDEITRPNLRWDGQPVAQTYWRSKPVQPGESFDPALIEGTVTGQTQPLVPTGNVTVTQSSTSSSMVTVSSVTAGLTAGATLLGQRVNMINGLTVTLAGNASENISSSTSRPFAPYQPFYFSPHANKVFASQAGRVTITWVSNVPDTTKPGESTPTYKFRQETFAVSSASQSPARVIYWTEKGFDGPIVNIPPGRIVRVNPVFNSFVTGMTDEYVPVGSNPGSIGSASENRTFWFDNENGPPSLHAYNTEGRLFIEYLGSENQGTTGVHQFIGADIVDIRRVAEVETITTHLGEKLRPRQGAPENGDDQLDPVMLFNLIVGGKLPYGSFIRPDGVTDYFAERESLDADRVTIYWMEPSDASIHFQEPPSAPGISVKWPKYKRNYIQRWPDSIAAFEPVNVLQTGAGPAVGPRFVASSLPQVIFQDDPNELEAQLDAATQRLVVDFSDSGDKTNRSLLKFSSSVSPWYVRIYIQSEEALGAPEIPDPDGSGPLTGTPARYTLNDLNADGAPDLNLTANVGDRLEPPHPSYALGGYISKGTCYSEAAYINPLDSAGVEAADAGGIIPVNALNTDRVLWVWWLKKIVPPSNKYEAFHVPAVAARYTVSYPASPQELVMASGKGVENPGLTSVQSEGSIYVQNDPSKIGYNPNEEHGLMLAGNAYALRDDLNTASSSEPFVLIQYNEPATETVPARPAMRVLKVVRSNGTYPLVYNKIAGTPVQPPMPLTALPLPLKTDGKVRNTEEEITPDAAAGSGAPDAYDSFTFEDRKGFHWIYRGPHAGGAPSFGMKFYYYLREGFHFPSLGTQPAVGSIQPYIADTGSGEAVTLTYLPKWPDDPTLPPADQKVLDVLFMAETMALQKGTRPQVRGQSSAQVIYQQSIANTGAANPAVALHDPTRQKIALLEAHGLDKLPASILTSDYAGKTYFQRLPPNLQNRFHFNAGLGAKGGLVLVGEFIDEIASEDYFHLNKLSVQDIADLKALCPDGDSANKTKWDNAIAALSTTLETFRESTEVPGTYVRVPGLDKQVTVGQRSDVTDPDTAVDSYALSSTGKGTGYVTLVFGNGEAFTDEGDPVAMEIIKVSNVLYKGDLKILLSSNPLDEQVALRHSGDYGGEPENFEFEWRYGFAENGLPPAGDPATDPDWINPGGTLGSSILIGGSPTAVLSTPAVIMGDVWFTMRYKKTGGAYSDWMSPALVEGWVKRVLAKITPFNQRMDDLFNNSLNTDVSLLTQAGTRWEGNIALNLNNVNEAGLIEIYETVLNRAKDFTIGSGIDFGPSNDALILAAGYLHDLYTILGNEAFADAANPTISIDDQDTITEVNTSRYSFEAQVASSLEEELALLRGRDDFGLPEVGIAPAYNRLWWNYTRGIDSGEVLYAVNYNIREKEGGSAANGIVDAADAQHMFPQGHGDAYGHYLTALKGYYKLLTHPQFTWTPRAEAVNILGQPVLIDYQDERKFAAAASNVARTTQQVLALVHRQNYRDDPGAGWAHFRDGKENTRTEVVRHLGLDETASRSAQGAFFNWVVGNALLPDEDTNPSHTGVQIIDRTTVPELDELTGYAESFQTTMDLANAHLNPLGLSPGAIAFDISPAEHQAGKSHYEQVYERALGTLLNAKGSFDQAAKMTRLLRNQENQIADQQTAIEDQEYAFLNELYDIYGMAYPGDIGPGKTYQQGYEGPDTENWFIIDRPVDLVDTTKPVTVTVRVPTNIRRFTGDAYNDIAESWNTKDTVVKTFKVTPNQVVQFADVVGPGTALGKRPYTGALQEALLEAHLAQVALLEANHGLQFAVENFLREGEVFRALVQSHKDNLDTRFKYGIASSLNTMAASALNNLGISLQWAAEAARDAAEAVQEALPKSVGLATDMTAPARGAVKFAGFGVGSGFMVGAIASYAGSSALEGIGAALEADLEIDLEELGFDQDELQAVYEFEQTYREMLSQHHQFVGLMAALQTANQKVENLRVAGDTILLRRETLRKRAAAVLTGYRTKDLTFRTFRNEALEQYRTLYDLAARYSYLAAKSYDYETGLLGTTQGQAVINRLVASRSLGDLTGGVPQATTSTLGDAGLAGTLAQMNADFAVAEGRLGINNPDPYGTLFSLRHEMFRIVDDPDETDDDAAWQQTLEQHIMPDLMADPHVAKYCNNIKLPGAGATPGILIPFSTVINHTDNFFGLPGAAGDHAYSPSSYATKVSSSGIVFKGYIGMDPYAFGTPNAGGPNTSHPDALRATPYVYFIPCGYDYMLAPPLGDTNTVRAWAVHDQALPLPYNLGANDFNATQFFSANGTLSEQPWILRKHQAFRPVSDPAFFYSTMPAEFTNRRLIGRSVWNSQWKIVIPAYTLLSNEQEGLNRFVRSVKDIQLFLRTYSHSGN